MAGFRGKFAGAFLGLAVLTAGLLFSAGPAGAFWGDYGEAPPEFFGVRLGDDIRDYPDMKLDNGGRYYRETDNNASIAGMPMQGVSFASQRVYYYTYKNRVYSMVTEIFLEDFEEFRQYMAAEYGLAYQPERIHEGYCWGSYEVSIMARGYFPVPGNAKETQLAAQLAEDERREHGHAVVTIEIKYLPVIIELIKEHYNNFKASYRGVFLGSKAADYDFLRPYRHDAPDLTYYYSTKPLGDVRGMPVIAEDYAAYQGVIYRIEITSDKWNVGDGGEFMRFADLVLSKEYGHLFDGERFIGVKNLVKSLPYLGDSEFIITWNGLDYTHMPTYWRAMRAKVAYHRNVKPD